MKYMLAWMFGSVFLSTLLLVVMVRITWYELEGLLVQVGLIEEDRLFDE